MLGLMQEWPLTVDKILDHAKTWHGDREVITRGVEGEIRRSTYARIHARAKSVSALLMSWGLRPGDRVATLGWNTDRHMETWYGIMGIGLVCHTLNPRLFTEQLIYIINHADDQVIFADHCFAPLLETVLPHCPGVKRVVLMTDNDHMPKDGQPGAKLPGLSCYEALLQTPHPEVAWGGFDEHTACGLCYTSGTTDNPKGVLYSHRSNVLHTLFLCTPDVMGASQRDSILPIVPMFHANAWGVVFAAPAVGAKLVFPGSHMDGKSIHELLETEKVTFSAAVPTVWQMLLTHLQDHAQDLTSLKRVVIGGAACPEILIRRFWEDYGVEVQHAWGMTESSPLGTCGALAHPIDRFSFDHQIPWRLKQGRVPLGVDLKIVDETGARLPRDGKAFGHLMIKGPAVARTYYGADADSILDAEGYFNTGDVATLDAHGYMKITDRAKDVIKSGGEWINSIEIENIAVGHPKAALCAVIGIKHPKWDERPLLLVQLRPGETATGQEFLAHLKDKIAKWWMPDAVEFIDQIPLGATGKIDKKRLRQRFEAYVFSS